MNELQREVAEFIAAQRLHTSAHTRLLDVQSELGELSKTWLRATDYGARSFVSTPMWRDEFGDVLFALLCLANETQTDATLALQNALAKYRARIAISGAPDSQR